MSRVISLYAGNILNPTNTSSVCGGREMAFWASWGVVLAAKKVKNQNFASPPPTDDHCSCAKVIFASDTTIVRVQRSCLPDGRLMFVCKGHVCPTEGLCSRAEVIRRRDMTFSTWICHSVFHGRPFPWVFPFFRSSGGRLSLTARRCAGRFFISAREDE